MDLYNLVLSAKLIKGEGGGGDIDVDALTVTENGVYSASSGHAYSPVTVSVPQSGITPTGTSNITANGIYDVTNFASASVAVPGASGTTNITSNGIYDIASFASASVNVPGIVPSGTSSITSNGIYDITNFASVDVNVSGGGGGFSLDDLIARTISGVVSGSTNAYMPSYLFYNCNLISGAYFPNVNGIGSLAFTSCTNLTTASFENANQISYRAFSNCTALTSVSFPNVKSINSYAFQQCIALKTVSFPNVSFLSEGTFKYCSALEKAYFSKLATVGDDAFCGCSKLSKLYILGSSVPTLSSNNAFFSTPIVNSAYLGYYGSIYVPASLIDSYKTAAKWSVYSSKYVAYEGE